MPLKYIDVGRRTYTDVETPIEESEISDCWTTPDASREVSSDWTGRTCFNILRPKPPQGYYWVEGRLTKRQKTTRPDNVWPEVWKALGRKEKG